MHTPSRTIFVNTRPVTPHRTLTGVGGVVVEGGRIKAVFSALLLNELAVGVEIEDGVAYIPDRSSFGGSIATANRLARTMFRLAEVPLNEAVKMMTLTPPPSSWAVACRKGSLAPRKDADIVLLDENVDVRLVMVKGEICLSRM
jgi:N-acetylglucosamine-6-phosphate deacetylase